MEENKLVPLENAILTKANVLISAKYKSTLLENQVTALALTRIQQNLNDGHEDYIAEIYPDELKQLFKSKSNVYRTLKQLSNTLMGKQILVEDGKGNFIGFVLIPNVEYNQGVLRITFNKQIKPLIYNLQKNFTSFDVAVLMSFSSNNAYRLYELFKKELYESNRKLTGTKLQLEYGIAELKFTIGICDINNPEIKNLKARMGNILDYDLLYDKLPKTEKKYNQSADFMRSVIKPAQKELLEDRGLQFEYEGIKTKGNKIGRIRFTIFMDSINKKKVSKAIVNKAEYIDEQNKAINTLIIDESGIVSHEIPVDIYQEFVGFHNLTRDDIDTLCKKADYDFDRVKNAIYYTDSRGNISEFMNYVVSVIDHPEWDLEGTAVYNGKDLNPELIKIAKEQNNEQKREETVQKNPQQIWETVIKPRADFDEFIKHVEETDHWGLEEFELIFQYQEMIDYWKKWRLNKK